VLSGWRCLSQMEAAGSESGATTAPVLLESCRLLDDGEDGDALVEAVAAEAAAEVATDKAEEQA
jgi:hypothetical protein